MFLISAWLTGQKIGLLLLLAQPKVCFQEQEIQVLGLASRGWHYFLQQVGFFQSQSFLNPNLLGSVQG